MKKNKLESISNSKFNLNEQDMLSVKGGGVDYSREYFTTHTQGELLADSKVIDVCVVFK